MNHAVILDRESYDCDPHNDLDLSDTARKIFLKECQTEYINQYDKLLKPYGGVLYPDGSIIWNDRKDCLSREEVRELGAEIETSSILEKYEKQYTTTFNQDGCS